MRAPSLKTGGQRYADFIFTDSGPQRGDNPRLLPRALDGQDYFESAASFFAFVCGSVGGRVE